MIQVMYTKKGYQVAKRTAPVDRTDEQHLLMNIDFRSGPNPVVRMDNGKVRRIYPGQILVGETNYQVQKLIFAEMEGPADITEETYEEIPKLSEDSDEAEENEKNLSADDFFNNPPEEDPAD